MKISSARTLVGIALLMASGAAASAEQVLEMQLKPKSGAAASSAASDSKPQPQSRKTVRLPSRGTGTRTGETVPIGRVGYTTDKVSIKRNADLRAAELFSVDKNTPLAVVQTKDTWHGVLMVDGSVGWVPVDRLAISDVVVITDKSAFAADSELIRYALGFQGIPYVWGGQSRTGTDCSGFVLQVYRQFGRSLPRTAREQALVGIPVNYQDLQPGDRVYFNCKGGAVDHTGIYIGNGMMVHASSTRGGVAVESLDNYKYRSAFTGARRG